jgi:hypothetical protein
LKRRKINEIFDIIYEDGVIFCCHESLARLLEVGADETLARHGVVVHHSDVPIPED